MPNPDTPDTWDAETYGRYADERARPFHDLLARVGTSDPREVVDLGCGAGTGLLTMVRRWPGARFVGVDGSVDMLATAEAALGGAADMTLIQADAVSWSPQKPADVLVSNALLQWIPDHAELLSKMTSWLAPQGWMAIQVPGNFEAPSHTLLRQLADSPQWTDRLRGVLRGSDTVHDAAGYFEILAATGLAVDAWETTYLHVLTGPDPVLHWTRGTALLPVLAVLSAADAREFCGQYADLLRIAYPADDAGRVLFRFRRIFAVGRREESG